MNGDAGILDVSKDKFQLSLSYIELPEFIDRDTLKMNENWDFSYIEEKKWQDITGFGR